MQIELSFVTDPLLLEAIEKNSKLQVYESGQTLIEPGQYMKMVPIILEGSVKVMRTDEEGHELMLYYIKSGETCALLLTCCSTDTPSDIKAVAEEKTTV